MTTERIQQTREYMEKNGWRYAGGGIYMLQEPYNPRTDIPIARQMLEQYCETDEERKVLESIS
jgi:hypothetical protein